MEAQVTSVEVLEEKIVSALVMEGLYSWWLQRRLVYARGRCTTETADSDDLSADDDVVGTLSPVLAHL